MNRKRQYQILVKVLIVLVLINLVVMVGIILTTPANDYTTTPVGNNTNGTVYKVEAGDLSSNETVVIILGVHPNEKEIHDKINDTIYNITSENGTKDLNKKFIIYFTELNSNMSDEESRIAGEQLADQFIVPNVIKDNPRIAVDVHEVNPEEGNPNYITNMSNRTAAVNSIIAKLSTDLNLIDYQFSEGSPLDVTQKIADGGVDTVLISTSQDDPLTQKQITAENLVRSLNEL